MERRRARRKRSSRLTIDDDDESVCGCDCAVLYCVFDGVVVCKNESVVFSIIELLQ